MLLEGKVAIVTGGGRGIGAGISRVLAGEGAAVAVVYVADKDSAEEVAAGIVKGGGRAQAFEADVREADAVQAMTDAVVGAFGRVDGLINNAIGGRQDGSFEEISWDNYTNMLDFGCKAVFNTVKAAHPVMKQQGAGRIVNIVTELWNMGSANWSAYLAGKGAMVGMSRSLANELGPAGITVNMVAPGWMLTDKVDPESEGSKRFGQSLPVRWHGTGEEIGKACAFFLSDLASYVTGAYLPVCGGRITQMGA